MISTACQLLLKFRLSAVANLWGHGHYRYNLLGSFAALHSEVAPLLIPNWAQALETADGTYFRHSKPIG